MLLTFFFLLILETSSLFLLVQSSCFNGNYTRNSTYANNLNALLSSIPDNINVSTGFYSGSAGQPPDRAYATILCRGDILPDVCRRCIREITSTTLTACPYQRQAAEWWEHCTLRYSDEVLLGNLQTNPYVYVVYPENATSAASFAASLQRILEDLRGRAAAGGPLRKVAAGNTSAPDFLYIFALEQCSPDLSEEDCSTCLIEAARQIPLCCNNRNGARITMSSCNLHFQTTPFVNETRLLELQPVQATPEVQPPQVAPEMPSPPTPGTGNGKNTSKTVIIVIVSVVSCAVIVVVIGCTILRKRVKRKPEEVQHNTDDESSIIESLKYSLSTIREATNDFSDDSKLGEGGFGAVYKGVLSSGEEIAVKRLSKNSRQGGIEFKNEVALLAKLQHRNLVRLLGFCLEGAEKLLVYEFLQNASLDLFIFDPVKRSYLDWDKRAKIIGGIARGILYLHEDSQLRIIHRDLKPSNVLLDGSMNPKIADFGMASLFGQDESHRNTTRVAGTYGYMAPEYVINGHFSIKSDVFSFGVLLLEIITGRKNNCVGHQENIEHLLSIVWKNWKDGTAANLVDPYVRSRSGTISEMLRCIHIGLLCVQENSANRPTMASVVLMLNNFSITLAAPSEPAFYMTSDYGSNTSIHRDHNSIQSDRCSRNEASITDLYPR